jgi:predicted transcriptional regulator
VVDDGIPARVKQLITEHVDSVMQLEVLLLLAGQAGQAARVWTAAELAQHMRVDAAWVESTLRGMTGKGLVAVTDASGGGGVPQFRYEPRTAELGAAVNELAEAYADRRVTVISLIFAKPTDKLRSFADAFRLRKDRTD